MSNFNADSFLQQVVTQKMDEARTPVPEGDHLCDVRELSFKTGTVSKGDNAGKEWVMLTAKCAIQDPNVAAEMELEEAFLYPSFFLDLTDDGALATGTNKNVELGRFRAACGQNEDGEWSLGMLQGATVGLTNKHEINDAGDTNARVTGYYKQD